MSAVRVLASPLGGAGLLLVVPAVVAQAIASSPPATSAPSPSHQPPFVIERFSLPGPLAGVVARVDVSDPRVRIEVALTDDTDPDGDGPCAGQLDFTSAAARKRDYTIALNASFFSAPKTIDVLGNTLRYVAGNCTWPVGWHVREGKTIHAPEGATLRAALLVFDDGRLAIDGALAALPKGVRHAVSGNVMVLRASVATASEARAAHHPRSAVGLSQDGKTFVMLAIDGRQATAEESPTGQAHSRGATYQETGELMKRFGAYDAINLDGGGSTTMVAKDPRTGAFSLLNRPSDATTLKLPFAVERPVADVVGVRVDWTAPPAAALRDSFSAPSTSKLE